jgi:hypothetical protein
MEQTSILPTKTVDTTNSQTEYVCYRGILGVIGMCVCREENKYEMSQLTHFHKLHTVLSKMIGQSSRVLHHQNKEKVHINMSRNEWFLSLIERFHSTINTLTM